MKKKEYCFTCDKEVEPKINYEINNYKINGENFNINEKVYTCPYCNDEIDVEDVDQIRNIYEEYLKLYNLTFDDFKSIRNSYNLSQELFSKVLGWGKRTIARYESGASFPQKEYLDTYARIKDKKDEFIKILNQNKKRLGDDYYNIINCSGLYDRMKTINTIIYMFDKNPLNKTQMMKNMFAVDFYNSKINGKPLTILKYARADHGPIIDKYITIINYLLHNSYLSIYDSKTSDQEFISTFQPDLKFYNEKEINCMKLVKAKLKGKTATKLSEWSHEFIGWQKTNNGKIIDYKYSKYFNLDI